MTREEWIKKLELDIPMYERAYADAHEGQWKETLAVDLATKYDQLATLKGVSTNKLMFEMKTEKR